MFNLSKRNTGVAAVGIAVTLLLMPMATLPSQAAPGQITSSATTVRTLPAGTVVKVKLVRGLDSSISQRGDQVRATVAPDDVSGLPVGSTLLGRVTASRAATSTHPGVIDIHFDTLRVGAAGSQALAADLTPADSPAVDETANVHASGGVQQQDHNRFIGYGAGAGAVVGTLMEHNSRGFIKGGLLGAAAGFLTSKVAPKKSNPQDVRLKSSTEFSVVLRQPLTVRTAVRVTTAH